MVYNAPDYEVVKLNVKETFSSYGSSCPNDESHSYTQPCTPKDPNYFYENYVADGWAHQCYSTLNAPGT